MSPEEAKRKYEEALAALPPEVQETFRMLAANARPRPCIDSLDKSTVRGLAPEDVEIAVVEFVDRQIQSSEDRCNAVLSLTRGLQVFYLSFIVEAEVMNGGFNQFFWNSSSEYAELIAPALRELGASEAAEIFEQALAVANAEIETTAEFRRSSTLEAFSASYEHTRLNEFDSRFCKLAEQFPALRLAIIHTNEPTFFPDSPGG
jgi:hypothetical protein